MSPAADPGSAEAELANRVYAAIKAAVNGDPKPFVTLAQEHTMPPEGLAIMSVAACSTLFSIAHKQAKRIAELEKAPTLKYCGTYTGSVPYQAGEFATHGGSLFHCNVNGTTERPGTGAAWTLCCKAGKDGKDLR